MTRRHAGTGVAAASAIATAALFAFAGDVSLWWQIGLFLTASSLLGALVTVESLRSSLSRGGVFTIVGVTLLFVAVLPPRYSTDTSNYAAYGRIVSEHGSSPYTHAPSEFPSDPVIARIPPRWADTRSPYGPAFTVFSAGVSYVTGTSDLASRLFYQGAGLVAALASLLLLRRAGAPPVALALVGLHPATAAAVNGGNNDLLVGLAILGGVLLAMHRRPLLAGAVLGVGALVKLGACLALGGVAVWLLHAYGRRAALRLVAIGGAVVVGGYVLAGGRSALEPLSDATRQWSRSSFWNAPRDWLADVVSFSGPVARGVHRGAAELTSNVATLTIAIVTVSLLIVFRRQLDAPRAAMVGPVVFLLLAAYALPRYGLWALPVAGLVWRSTLTRLLAISTAVLQFVYLRPADTLTGPATGFLERLDQIAMPIVVGVAIVLLVRSYLHTQNAGVSSTEARAP